MDPITLTAVAAAVGTAVSAISASQAANYNAELAEMQAVYATDVAAAEETRVRRVSDYQMGKLRARAGASGRAMSGSVLDVLHESAINYEMDALNARYEGEVQAIGYRNEARMQKFKAKTELLKGVVSLASGELAGQGLEAAGANAPTNLLALRNTAATAANRPAPQRLPGY